MSKTQSTQANVLIVDDNAAARESMCDVLAQCGYEVQSAASAVEALPKLEGAPMDVVVTDLQMPGMDGLEFIRQINQRRLQVQVLMITAHATIASAVEAMRFGAFDYLEKPFNVSQLEERVAQAVQRGALLRREETANSSSTIPDDGNYGMVGNSAAMCQLRTRIRQVAATEETILICGESGTGKELVARAIHGLSSRSQGPLVSVNCPALSPQLAESEFFGHQKGAYTGAETDRAGRFELAHDGTLLLDEITEIDLPLQAKLLRVLQEKTFERVGASDSHSTNARIIATTNRELHHEVAAGSFRQDLYYRLAVLPIELPPLRARGDDVLLLADYFLRRAAMRLEKPVCELDAEAKGLFQQYHWPGNVRELENIVTRACVLNTEGWISAAELRPWLEQPEENPATSAVDLPVGVRLDEMERQMIVATLEYFDGHRQKTAEALGIGVRTLSGKLREYGYAPRTKDFASPPLPNRQDSPSRSAFSAGRQYKKSA